MSINIGRMINTIAALGKYRGLMGLGFSVENPRPLSLSEKLRCLPAGLWAKIGRPAWPISSQFAPAIISTNGPNKNLSASRFVMPYLFFSEGAVAAGQDRPLITDKQLEYEVVKYVQEKVIFTAEGFAWRLEQDYRAPFPVIIRYLENVACQSVAGRKPILMKVGKNNSFYCLATTDLNEQGDKISAAESKASRVKNDFYEFITQRGKALSQCTDTNSLFRLIVEERNRLGFRGVYLFLLNDGMLAQIDGTSNRENAYKTPRPLDGLFARILNGPEALWRFDFGGNETTTLEEMVAAVKANKNIVNKAAAATEVILSEDDKTWLANSLHANSVRLLDILVLRDKANKPYGVLLLRNPIYFGLQSQDSVDTHLRAFASNIGEALSGFYDTGTVAGPAAREEIADAQAAPSREQLLFNDPLQYHGGSKMLMSGRFTTEYSSNPSFAFALIKPFVIKDANKVVKAVLGEELPEQEMEDHIIRASHTLVDRVGGTVTGFAASSEYTDYKDTKGRISKLIYYKGIMVDPQYRGGRVAYLSFRMMAQIFKGLRLRRLLWGKTPVVFRTQDKSIIDKVSKYLALKKNAADFSAEDWQAINFTANREHWTMEPGTNICRGCYHRLMAKDKAQVITGLEERDGEVYVGYANWWSAVKLLWDAFRTVSKIKNGKINVNV